jgi:regulatory protein
MKSWCAYQERSQYETRRKLHGFKLPEHEIDQLIARLITENYLNEERFAIALAGGKFRIKKWGKIKIKSELRKHHISDYLVQKALKHLDNNYIETLEHLIEKKIEQSGTLSGSKLYYTVLKYAVSKGFESDIVAEQLRKQIPIEL